MSSVLTENSGTIWAYLHNAIGNSYGVAGLMGNLYAESALRPNNMQNSYESVLGYTDETYTKAVDSGAYASFANDGVGYGLAQWTYRTRKANLQAYMKNLGVSIADLEGQLSFLTEELKSEYPAVLKALKGASTVREAAKCVLAKYECPADQSESALSARAGYGSEYWDAYAGNGSTQEGRVTAENYADYYEPALAGEYVVTAYSGLNVREGAGVGFERLVAVPKGFAVRNYGYYSKSVDGVAWLYVQFAYDGVLYTGFACGTYLQKKA